MIMDILDKPWLWLFGKIAKKANELFGVSNFTLARGGVFIVATSGVLFLSLAILGLLNPGIEWAGSPFYNLFFAVLGFYLSPWSWTSIQALQDHADYQNETIAISWMTIVILFGCKIHTALSGTALVVVGLPLLIFSALEGSIEPWLLAHLCLQFGMVASCTLMRCFTPPGTRGKVFKWTDALKRVFTPAKPRLNPSPIN